MLGKGLSLVVAHAWNGENVPGPPGSQTLAECHIYHFCTAATYLCGGDRRAGFPWLCSSCLKAGRWATMGFLSSALQQASAQIVLASGFCFLFLKHSLAVEFRLAWNSLYCPGWPQTLSSVPDSASLVLPCATMPGRFPGFC